MRHALILLASAFVQLPFASATCKCLPSESCWPSDLEWESLNATIGGRLIHSVPPGSVCYPERPNYNATACDEVVAAWTTSKFHSSNPVSIDSPVWTNNSCNPIFPNGTSVTGDQHAGERGCSIGSYPVYVVNATQTSHVQAALEFAQRWNVRVNIKNTGHNGSGRNIAFGSISIWTHHMKQIQYSTNFIPSGSPSRNDTGQMAFTLGAGVQDGELFDALPLHNVIAVGGTNKDVGVVGWALGGGHGLMTGHYGNGADNIIQATIVTPSGAILVANAFQNQDLFWAIRGGGGGTFGIVVDVTLKAYPMPAVVLCGLNFSARNGTSAKAWWDLVAQVHGLLPDALDQGLSGYYTIEGPPRSSTLSYGGSLFMYNAEVAAAEAAMRPLEHLLSTANGTATSSTGCFRFETFSELISQLPSFENVGTVNSISASRLLTRDTLKNKQAFLARTLERVGPQAVPPADGLPNYSISGTLTISQKPVHNALNPAWRDTTVHLITSRLLDDSYPHEQINSCVADMTYDKLSALWELDPGSGAYLNEANAFEPGWQWSFFGANYPRLHVIKRRYDPDGLLWCPQCVGSEDWVQNDAGRLCQRYQPF
ncbi:FAD/FMN-containing dehydrogenase [Aspergillus pseudoustus]|uniref:FAD/FMN-containing dehydrogenase n=1 Tax=Aspergillus pseudoustus TaxID=1810923 RepID=A0ABR4JTL0_9EURO